MILFLFINPNWSENNFGIFIIYLYSKLTILDQLWYEFYFRDAFCFNNISWNNKWVWVHLNNIFCPFPSFFILRPYWNLLWLSSICQNSFRIWCMILINPIILHLLLIFPILWARTLTRRDIIFRFIWRGRTKLSFSQFLYLFFSCHFQSNILLMLLLKLGFSFSFTHFAVIIIMKRLVVVF